MALGVKVACGSSKTGAANERLFIQVRAGHAGARPAAAPGGRAQARTVTYCKYLLKMLYPVGQLKTRVETQLGIKVDTESQCGSKSKICGVGTGPRLGGDRGRRLGTRTRMTVP